MLLNVGECWCTKMMLAGLSAHGSLGCWLPLVGRVRGLRVCQYTPAGPESREQRAEIVAEDKVQINNRGSGHCVRDKEGHSNKTWDTGSGTGYMLGQTPHMRSNLAKIFGLVQHTVCVKRTHDTHDSRQQIAMGTQSQGTPDISQESLVADNSYTWHIETTILSGHGTADKMAQVREAPQQRVYFSRTNPLV